MGGWYELTIGRLLAKPRGFVGDHRAQSQVIGAVLIFAFVVAALGAAQVVLVPQANEDVEFSHNQQAQRNMQDLRQSIQRSAVTGTSQSASIDLAPDYPTRLLLLNPPESAGSLRTTEGDLEIDNARALDDENVDFWDGGPMQDISSNRIVYTPSYNVYDNAPKTIYENSVLYNKFENGEDISRTDQDVVDGQNIYLTALGGDKSASETGAASVDVAPVSPASETIAVTREAGGEPVTVTIPTQLSEKTWVRLLSEEIDDTSGPQDGPESGELCGPPGQSNQFSGVADNDRFIVDCIYDDSADPHKLTLIFQETQDGDPSSSPVTYNLRMAKLGVGTDVDTPDTSYVTAVQGDGASITNTQTVDLTLEARDRFNNPKSGTDIIFTTTAGSLNGQPSPVTLQTGEGGEATVTFDPSINSGEAEITGVYDRDGDGDLGDESDKDRVKFRVEVGDTFSGSGGIGNDVNPSGPVVLDEAIIVDDSGSDANNCQNGCNAKITLRNDGSEGLEIDEIRINYYDAQSPGVSVSDRVGSAIITDDEMNSETIEIQKPYEGVTLAGIPSGGGTQSYTFRFEKNDNTDYDVSSGDFYIVSVIYEDQSGNQASSFTYFVAPV